MPGESLVQVTEGSGKKLHTWQTTVGANNVEDEFVVPGEYPYASYVIPFVAISIGTANDHVIQVMAGASLKVRIRRIALRQDGSAAAAAQSRFELFRLTTAGTGGGAITPEKLDPSDAASGCSAMTLPGVKGTESATRLGSGLLIIRQAVSATAVGFEGEWRFEAPPSSKGIVLAAGLTNGICIKNMSARATATVSGEVWVTETAF